MITLAAAARGLEAAPVPAAAAPTPRPAPGKPRRRAVRSKQSALPVPAPVPEPSAVPAPVAEASPGDADPAMTGSAAASNAGERTDRPDCTPVPYGWLSRVAQIINMEQRYPALSRQLGEHGTVYLRLSLDRSGLVLEAPLLQSSGYRRLDEEAQDLVRRIRSFGRVPDSACPDHRILVIDQPIRFTGR